MGWGDVGVIIVISFSLGFLQAIVRWERPSFMYFAHFQRPNCRAWWPLVTLLLSLSFANLQGMMRWDVSSATYFDQFQRPNCTVRWPLLLFLLFLVAHFQRPNCTVQWPLLCFLLFLLLWFLVNVSGIGKLLIFEIIFEECFRFWDLLLAKTRFWVPWFYLGESSVLGESEHIT